MAPKKGDLTDEDTAFKAALSGGGGGSIGLDFSNLGDMNTEHAEDAIDFEDEDELAEDELPEEEESSSRPINGDDDDDDFFNYLEGPAETPLEGEGDSEDESKHPDLAEQEEQEQIIFQEKLLKHYYPSFKKNEILRMNSVFGPKPQLYPYHLPPFLRPLVPLKVTLEVEPDQRRIFKSTLSHMSGSKTKRVVNVEEDDLLDPTSAEKKRKTTDLNEDLMLATIDWDYEKIVSGTPDENEKHALNDQLFEDYDDDMVFDGQIASKLQLDLNDSHLLFIEDTKSQQNAPTSAPLIPTNEKLLQMRFNISNDKNYDLLKENYHSKIRSTIGNLNVEHSLPAIRLQSPYYKVKMSKAQIRDFHRSRFKVRAGQLMQFSKLKLRKKKRDKGKEISESFAQTTDLTIADTAQTILLEHSEQVPIVLQNFGMGSKLINYYRKRNDDDTSRPKLPLGETHVLGVQDKSPFWNFGFVEPGNVVPTVYNKMVRAPVFKQEPFHTDFLLIKSTGAGVSQKFFLKPLNHIFVVGQLMPVVDIPGPHSRKVTTASKNRLKMIVYRVLKRNPEKRLVVKDISIHFPEQSDMQNRQRLKEFMEYQRSGDDQGFWKLKEELPTERLITPDDLTLLESMQVGQQYLEDLEFYSSEEVNDDSSIWNLTKNFINATQGKAMLQLTGDPEGKPISFQKTSMKGGFKSFESNGHSYNVALQQKAYDEEISRAWYTQQQKLSGDEPLVNQEQKNTESSKVDEEQPKVLRITRMVVDENGIKQRTYEIVRDRDVINAYIKRREKMEEDINPDEVKITNDEEKNQKTKKLLEERLAKLEKNQERRNQRKAQRENTNKGVGKGKSTTRRCATCGAIGHIRTNKSCPMYDEANP